jgi:hypothetical protein
MITPAAITRALIYDIAISYQSSPAELLSTRGPRRLLAARIEIAKALRARGYSCPRIAAVMNRDHSTVCYYLDLCAKRPSRASLALAKPLPVTVDPEPEPPKPRQMVRYAGWDPAGKLLRNGNKTPTT